MTDADPPRLPQRAPEPLQLPLDLDGSSPVDPPPVVIQPEWVEYVEPDLLRLNVARRCVVASRALVVLWAIGTLAVAVAARSAALDGFADGGAIQRMAGFGALAAVVVAVAGWYLANRVTVDIHRLDGRLPSRFRCVTAWSLPIVCSGLLAVTVLRLEPTELLDVRPVIVGLLFPAAAWRPYSLIRRMIRSLVRVDSDLLVGAAYVLDLASLGLLWWRAYTFPSLLVPSNASVASGFIGLAAVALLASAANVLIWVLLNRDVAQAVEHRRIAHRTRHEHKQLRFRGIDPMQPEVRLALLRIKQEDAERRRTAESEARQASPKDGVPESPVEPAAEPEARQASPKDGVPESPVEPAAEPAGRSAPSVEGPQPEVSRPSSVTAEPAGPAAADGDEPLDDAPEPAGPRKEIPRQAARASEPSDMVRDELVPDGDAPGDQDALLDRLADGARTLGDPVGTAPEDIQERLAGRLNQETDSADSMFERLAQLGVSVGGGDFEPVPESGTGSDVPDGSVLTLDHSHSLQMARYLLLIAVVAVSAASGWLLMRAVGVDELIDGNLTPSGVERLDVARRAGVGTLSVALAVVPLWCAVAATWMKRVGMAVAGTRRCYALFGLALVANVVTAIVDNERGTVSLLGTFVCLGAAIWSISVMTTIQSTFQRSTTVTSFLPITLSFVVVTSWIGGLQSPVVPGDSVETLSFFAGLQLVSSAVVLIVAAVSTADVVEAIQLSPAFSTTDRERSDGEAPGTADPQ